MCFKREEKRPFEKWGESLSKKVLPEKPGHYLAGLPPHPPYLHSDLIVLQEKIKEIGDRQPEK